MELRYDWNTFRFLFYSQSPTPIKTYEGDYPLYLVVQEGVIVSVFSNFEDFSSWVGFTLDKLQAEFSQKEIIVFEKAQVDEWLSKSTLESHFYGQLLKLKENARSYLLKTNESIFFSGKKKEKIHQWIPPEHFLLEFIRSSWSYFLPSHYCIFLSFSPFGAKEENNDEEEKFKIFQRLSFLLVIQRGKLISFQVPDLKSVLQDKVLNSEAVMRALSSYYSIPIQGVFLSLDQWSRFFSKKNAWKNLSLLYKKNKKIFVPPRLGISLIIKIKSFF